VCLPLAASSPASAESTSASTAQVGSAVGKSSTTPTANPPSPPTGPMCPDTETSRPSIGQPSSELICSPEASPVSPSAWLESSVRRLTSGGSGPSSHAPFAHYDPDTSSWRTSQGSASQGSREPIGTLADADRERLQASGGGSQVNRDSLTAATRFGPRLQRQTEPADPARPDAKAATTSERLWRTPQAGEGNGGGGSQ
jgi:hypothetical protein